MPSVTLSNTALQSMIRAPSTSWIFSLRMIELTVAHAARMTSAPWAARRRASLVNVSVIRPGLAKAFCTSLKSMPPSPNRNFPHTPAQAQPRDRPPPAGLLQGGVEEAADRHRVVPLIRRLDDLVQDAARAVTVD